MKNLIAAGIVTAAFAVAAGYGAISGLETTGYSYFDKPDGSNMLCAVDPDCRRLSYGEQMMARSVFGDSIDYTHVKLFNRYYAFMKGITDCHMAPNGNIYMPLNRGRKKVDDFSLPGKPQTRLMHELTHVWQYQQGMNIYGSALSAWLKNGLNDYGQSYKFDVNGKAKFGDLNLEQQAMAVEKYFTARSEVAVIVKNQGTRAEIEQACQSLVPLENKLKIALPIQKEAACNGVKVVKPTVSAQVTPPAPALAVPRFNSCA